MTIGKVPGCKRMESLVVCGHASDNDNDMGAALANVGIGGTCIAGHTGRLVPRRTWWRCRAQ